MHLWLACLKAETGRLFYSYTSLGSCANISGGGDNAGPTVELMILTF